MGKIKELQEEFRLVFSGRGATLFDSVLPVLVFLIMNPLTGAESALWGAIIASGLISSVRIIRKEKITYALGGVAGVLLAGLFVYLMGSGAGFYLPKIISGVVTVVLCVLSIVVKRPAAAWSSYITRRWPLAWYWHPKVLPAYNEVTAMWAVVLGTRAWLELQLLGQDDVEALGATSLLLGWPFIVVLLIVSYIYGLWRLGRLRGPSIEEFIDGKLPPWKGQQRGF